MKVLRHPNIVAFIHTQKTRESDQRKLYIRMEYVDGGTLQSKLYDRDKLMNELGER